MATTALCSTHDPVPSLVARHLIAAFPLQIALDSVLLKSLGLAMYSISDAAMNAAPSIRSLARLSDMTRFAQSSSELAVAPVSLSPSYALCKSLLTAAALFSPTHVCTSVLDWKAPNSNFDHIMVILRWCLCSTISRMCAWSTQYPQNLQPTACVHGFDQAIYGLQIVWHCAGVHGHSRKISMGRFTQL